MVSVAFDQISIRINKHKPANEECEDEGHKVHNLEARSPNFIHNLWRWCTVKQFMVLKFFWAKCKWSYSYCRLELPDTWPDLFCCLGLLMILCISSRIPMHWPEISYSSSDWFLCNQKSWTIQDMSCTPYIHVSPYIPRSVLFPMQRLYRILLCSIASPTFSETFDWLLECGNTAV